MTWLMRRQMPVYREIGSGNGTAYPEVRMALGRVRPRAMLLVNERGEQIVSVAAPIHYRGAVQGVLLLSTRPGEIDEVLAEERNIIIGLALTALGGDAARLRRCSPAPSPGPCAGFRRRPRTSAATSVLAPSCPTLARPHRRGRPDGARPSAP